MASTPQSNQPRAQDQPSAQFSETNQPRAPDDHPPFGGTNPPATMSYAANPQQGYPVPQHYQGYPPNGNNPYYGDPSFAAYYPTTAYQTNEAASSFLRCFCIIMFLMLILTLIISVIMFSVVRNENPSFKVESFSVSNFNIVPESKIVSGKWDATIYMDNPSYLKMYVDKWDTALYHKDDYLASGSSMHSIELDSKSIGRMTMRLETYNTTASWAVEDMAKEQKEGGNVSFGLRLTLSYTMKNGRWWYHQKYRDGTLRLKCTDLKVGIPVGANTGNMPGGNSKGCDIIDN